MGSGQMPSLADIRQHKQLRFFQIVFEKSGSLFMVLESSTAEVGAGGYRVSVWNFNRTQNIDLVSHDDLELQQSSLGLSLLQRTVSHGGPMPGAHLTYQARQSSTHGALGQTA